MPHCLLLGEADFTFTQSVLTGHARALQHSARPTPARAHSPAHTRTHAHAHAHTPLWHFTSTCFDQEQTALAKYQDIPSTLRKTNSAAAAATAGAGAAVLVSGDDAVVSAAHTVEGQGTTTNNSSNNSCSNNSSTSSRTDGRSRLRVEFGVNAMSDLTWLLPVPVSPTSPPTLSKTSAPAPTALLPLRVAPVLFDCIVFNFPHIGTESTIHNRCASCVMFRYSLRNWPCCTLC